MSLKTITEEEVPMDYNNATKEITVNLPEHNGVLFVLETNKRTENTAIKYIWETFGDSIEEALLGYGYKLS